MARAHLAGTRAFFVVSLNAIAISWLCWLPLVAADRHLIDVPTGAQPLLVILGTFGPLLAALGIVARDQGLAGVRGLLGQVFRWRVGIGWYLAAAVLPAVVRIAVLWIHILKGGTVPDFSDTARWLALPTTFAMVLVLGGPIGEEFGWRGYAQPRLQSTVGTLAAAIAIGMVSGIWHAPLFLIPSTAQSHLPFALFLVRTLSLSIISAWLYNGSRRSMLILLLFHASLNTWPNALFFLEEGGSLGPYISGTILYTGWACLLILFGKLSGGRTADNSLPSTNLSPAA
jgi:membrane protease YdiL (CAAX protease family)